jgi:hypothetical protein
MRRRTVLVIAGAVILLVAGTVTGLAVMVRQEPAFYREKAEAPGEARRQQSKAFVEQSFNLLSSITGESPTWRASFTERQINSYFEEHFLEQGFADKVLPDAVSEPRVALDEDTVRLAFRYGSPPWSTVISIDLRVWQPKNELNVVALELQGLHAGSLPISAQSLLEEISEVARRKNIEVTWYRHGGNPVALLRFVSDRPRPTVQLKFLRVADGALTVAGISEPAPRLLGPAPTCPPPLGN